MNKSLKTCTLLTILFLTRHYSLAQASDFFITNGDNVSEVTCGGVLLAPHFNQNFLATNKGSAFFEKQIDLTKPFNTSFTMDMIDNVGEDGGAFVFQSDPKVLAEGLNSLGVKGITHSVAVTFDAIQNKDQNDPVFDHIAIQIHGNLDHSSPDNLAGPISMEPYYSTVQYLPDPPVTTFRHLISIDWDPAGKKLSVLIDGALVLSAVNDLVQSVFGGNPVVYWGFSGSNTQLTWYPAYQDLDWGRLYFYFGQILTRIDRRPEEDSCFAGPIQFIDSSIYSSGNGTDPLSFVSWYWNFGDGSISTERNPPPHQYPTPGSYTVKFAITNSSGCAYDTLIKKITLGSPPKPDFTAFPLCTNTDIHFTDKSIADVGIPTAWTWKFDNGSTSIDKDPVTQFSTTGPHIVSLTVQTEFVCRADTTITFMIGEKPIVDYSFAKDCLGNVQYLSALANAVAVDRWQWDFGDGRFSRQKDPSHFFEKDDTYTTRLWAVAGDCASDTITNTIAIRRVHAFAGNDTIAVVNQPVQLNATGGSNYEWAPHDFLNDAFIENPVATLPKDQTYVLTAKNDDGCEAKDTLNIKVYEHLEVYVPSAFTPNGDGRNDVLHIIAPGLKELSYFRVYDRWGQIAFETKDLLKGWDGRVKGQLPATGVYVWIMRGVNYLGNLVEKRGTVTLIR
ncbi:MAG TPA: PKD domain-containing protein [Chitinophagaceae bacterium]|nr:PKD domain-containing protein [Chitinophagaceae bacterium]